MEDVLVLIARIVFCGVFATAAIGHLTQTDAMAAYAESKGVPRARILVLIGGVALVLGSVSLVLGIWPDLGALALICFLIPTALTIHAFWRESDPQAKQMEQTQFFKDIALAGAALAFFVIFAYFGDVVGLTIIDPAFSFDAD